VSISSMLYEQLLHVQIPKAQKRHSSCQSFFQHFTLDFISLFALHSFSLVTVWLCDLWQKNIGTKTARKMLMKLTSDYFIQCFDVVFFVVVDVGWKLVSPIPRPLTLLFTWTRIATSISTKAEQNYFDNFKP